MVAASAAFHHLAARQVDTTKYEGRRLYLGRDNAPTDQSKMPGRAAPDTGCARGIVHGLSISSGLVLGGMRSQMLVSLSTNRHEPPRPVNTSWSPSSRQ